MAGKGSGPGERRGGREKGTPNVLPDLRAMTLKALVQAGGVDYLVRQASEEPKAFIGLLGRIVPREVHTEVSGELRIRQEVRRDLVEKLIQLMTMQVSTGQDAANPLKTITHEPHLMLTAQQSEGREALSRRAENARRDAVTAVSGAVQRAAAIHSG